MIVEIYEIVKEYVKFLNFNIEETVLKHGKNVCISVGLRFLKFSESCDIYAIFKEFTNINTRKFSSHQVYFVIPPRIQEKTNPTKYSY